VFVTLPVDSVDASGQVRRRRAMAQSFRALSAAGVEGVVMEVWWGLVEKNEPRVYDWRGYLELVALARRSGLKVRAVMAFHQCGTGPDDPHWSESHSHYLYLLFVIFVFFFVNLFSYVQL
jgi:beta-amylase